MKKYKVTQEFMDGLEEWQERLDNGEIEVNSWSFYEGVDFVEQWRSEPNSRKERYKRFGALLNWINGEDVFEVGTPTYIVQRKETNPFVGKEYLSINSYGAINIVRDVRNATKFYDFKNASAWANKHFEAVEVDE